LWTGLATAAAAYTLVAYYSSKGAPSWDQRLFRIVIASTFLWLAAGVTAGILTGLYHAAWGPGATHAYCATLRTSVLAGLSLLLAWAGPRWKRSELSTLVYPCMFLGAYRLVAQDLHQGHTGALFFSLLLYGAVLTTLPRLKRSMT
jgi:hypothetical protein